MPDAKPLRTMSTAVFAQTLLADSRVPDSRYSFFLGAGCSVSSGIPAAGSLVRDYWLPELCRRHEIYADQKDVWAGEHFPGYDPANPAALYGALIEELFRYPLARQREIERLCADKFPGFGYGCLAQLMNQPSGNFSAVLTTNFDDLLQDALYLYTTARPLVIHHESLAPFILTTRTRPLIVKLHGDNRLSPRNTPDETALLDTGMRERVKSVLDERGIIFIGYGGNDDSILNILQGLSPQAHQFPVYWVSGHEPRGKIRPWLEQRNATWVEQGDFDELMLVISSVFDLPLADGKRFEDVFKHYRETYDSLRKRVAKLPASDPDAPALQEAVKRTDKLFPDYWAAVYEADRLEKSDPDEANRIYESATEQFPQAAPLLGNYALFLKNIRRDYDGAEEHYRRALAADPNHANHLGNYALFLTDIRKDYDGAEEHYRRALAADPNDANNLGNYAGFLLGQGNPAEGLPRLEQVLKRLPLSDHSALDVECWFYAYAHRPSEQRREALSNLKRLLTAGSRSPGWDLSLNIERARLDGHPEAGWLEKLADVITKGENISVLEGWPAWQEA